jgi:hypothetical protein
MTSWFMIYQDKDGLRDGVSQKRKNPWFSAFVPRVNIESHLVVLRFLAVLFCGERFTVISM